MKNQAQIHAVEAEPIKPARSGGITGTVILTTMIAVAVLHYGQDVFLPLAIALLITFALSPLVSGLRRWGLPLLLSVLGTVAFAFAVIGLFLLIVVTQLGILAQSLPTFQANIVAKLEALQATGDGRGLLPRLIEMVQTINARIGAAVPADASGAQTIMPVEVVERQNAVQMLNDLVVPLISPVATSGLVVVVVIFMLLEREELRDRFIRLIGSNDLHRTTELLQDAGGRVTNYLLTQLLVNTIYALPIGLGLWLIGVPNALLWGLLTLVLRFVPYIGSVLAAAFPLFLAFAVSPDWSAVLWTLALFAVVELVTSNVIEPRLYGSRTGVSPLAIIVAAIFWTWIWGPLGLVLSTPLTVCLVVLGRHIPQFKLFTILFGDEPVLAPHSRLYQRLLAGDQVEAYSRAEEALETVYLTDYYGDVAIPALLLSRADHDRGVLTEAQQDSLADVAARVVTDLDEVVAEELEEAAQEGEAAPLAGQGFSVITIGGRTKIDDVAAQMLRQIMASEGADALALGHMDLMPGQIGALKDAQGCVILAFLDPSPTRASLLHIRRIKKTNPQLRVGVVIWQMPEGLASDLPPVADGKIREAEEIGADFVATDGKGAMAAAFRADEARPLPKDRRRTARRHAVQTVAAPAQALAAG